MAPAVWELISAEIGTATIVGIESTEMVIVMSAAGKYDRRAQKDSERQAYRKADSRLLIEITLNSEKWPQWEPFFATRAERGGDTIELRNCATPRAPFDAGPARN